MQFLMPTEEETRIVLKFQDGQPELVLDAMDIENVLHKILTMKIPEDSDLETEYILQFQKDHNRKLSKTGVSMLLHLKKVMIEKVKKNLFSLADSTGSTTSQSQTTEPSTTSTPLKKSSGRKKNSKSVP